MTAPQPKFHNVTRLACHDSLTIQAHKVMHMGISAVSRGFLMKHQRKRNDHRQVGLTVKFRQTGIVLWDCLQFGKDVRTSDIS